MNTFRTTLDKTVENKTIRNKCGVVAFVKFIRKIRKEEWNNHIHDDEPMKTC